MKVKRIIFVNRAPFGNLDIDFANNQVISLTGINGSGKTTLLSYIVDAFYEIARKAFQQEFTGVKESFIAYLPNYIMCSEQNSLWYTYLLI